MTTKVIGAEQELNVVAPSRTEAPAPKPKRRLGERGCASAPTNTRRARLQWDKKKTAELFQRCRATNDTEARNELISMYLNLVQYLASKYRYRGEPIDDLVQVGTIGLIKAVDRFDTGRGLEFTTYATPTIIGEIKRHFRDKTWMMKLPRSLQELSFKVNRGVDALTETLQRSPTIAEIAQYVGVTDEEVLDAMEASSTYTMVPLMGEHDDWDNPSYNLADVLGREDPMLMAAESREMLAAALSGVPELDQRVLHFRFSQGLTQCQIAAALGISQMQVSRVLRKTIALLRNRLLAPDGSIR